MKRTTGINIDKLMLDFQKHPLVVGLRVIEQYSDRIKVMSDEGRIFVEVPAGTIIPSDQVDSLKLIGWALNVDMQLRLDLDRVGELSRSK